MIVDLPNPYLDEWAEAQPLARSLVPWPTTDVRTRLVTGYSWAVPNEAALAAIIAASPRGVVEIGAGTGYWAGLLRARGARVMAYDQAPHVNSQAQAAWSEVLVGGPEMAAHHSDLALMLCWPPYAAPMAAEALRAYRGDTLIWIGEGDGGCTGDDEAWRIIAAEWREDHEVRIPQWPHIHDSLTVYRREVRP